MSEAMVMTNEESQTLQTIEQLDATVERMAELKRAGEKVAGELGREILRVSENGLWRLRTKRMANGKLENVHKNFAQWVERELGIRRSNAYLLMKVAKNFTDAQVEQHGTTKLSMLLLLPEAERAPVLEATTRKSVRETKEHVKALGREKRSTERAEAKQLQPSPPPTMPDPKKRVMTVAIRASEQVWLKRKNAKAPWTGELVLENHAKQKFTIRKGAKGTFILSIKTTRDE